MATRRRAYRRRRPVTRRGAGKRTSIASLSRRVSTIAKRQRQKIQYTQFLSSTNYVAPQPLPYFVTVLMTPSLWTPVFQRQDGSDPPPVGDNVSTTLNCRVTGASMMFNITAGTYQRAVYWSFFLVKKNADARNTSMSALVNGEDYQELGNDAGRVVMLNREKFSVLKRKRFCINPYGDVLVSPPGGFTIGNPNTTTKVWSWRLKINKWITALAPRRSWKEVIDADLPFYKQFYVLAFHNMSNTGSPPASNIYAMNAIMNVATTA